VRVSMSFVCVCVCVFGRMCACVCMCVCVIPVGDEIQLSTFGKGRNGTFLILSYGRSRDLIRELVWDGIAHWPTALQLNEIAEMRVPAKKKK